MEPNEKDKSEIELIIDKKISDAKLLVVEKRLQFVLTVGGALLAIMGVFIPLFLTQQSTNKVDQSIERMNDRFDELAGKQLRKPQIACFVDGTQLTNSTIRFDRSSMKKHLTLKNLGDGHADFIKIKLYLKTKTKYFFDQSRNDRNWQYFESDREGYEALLLSMGGYYPLDTIARLQAQDFVDFELLYTPPKESSGNELVDALLVVFYGEPRPIEIPFKFSFQ